ncbi:MAG: transglycosylase domain-containing protein [Dehalococcoidia bacterium]
MAKNIATRRLLRSRLRGQDKGSNHRPSAPRWAQLLIAAAGIFVVMFAIAGATGYGVYRSYANDLEPPDEVIASQPSGGAKIYDRNGKLLYEYVDDKSGLRSPVKLEDISPWMIAATISTEDWSFWDNRGVNEKGLARAALETLGLRDSGSSNTTGGSSITQQLVKNIYIPVEERYERSYERKLKETIYAVELTNRYSKDQILEWYLNQISYGGLYNGVEAASLGYFGKQAKDLNLAEAALLAGIPASPTEYDPINNPQAAVDRRNQVLRLMHRRAETTEEIDGQNVTVSEFQVNDDGTKITASDPAFYLSTIAPVNIVPQRFPVQAPHWVFDYVEKELIRLFGRDALYSGGLRVTTTLDLDLQQKAQVALETWISEFEVSADGHNGALVAMDPRTSEILVMVGSRDYFRDDIEGRNNNATSYNSPGSTLKPFAYAGAFEQLGWGTETPILDTPISFQDGDKVFTPRNPNGGFVGQISIRNALGNSLNIPAFKTALYLGVPNTVAAYKKFGLTGPAEDGVTPAPLDSRTLGPSLTIGGIDIRLVDVTYAYTVLANNGVMRGVPTTLNLDDTNRKLDPVSILQVTREISGDVLYPTTEDHRVKVQEERVLDAPYAYMINDILSDPNAFCITYGCGSLSIGRPWGVKTGTSEPFENSRAIGETWTYGYTPELVAGVWAGNSDNSPMFNITSTSISYRALRDFMVAALEEVPASDFTRPPGLKEVEVCIPSGMKPDADCARKVKTLLPDAKAPKDDDDWWRRAKIDIRDGLLATELTPPQFVQERFGIVIPDGLSEFAMGQAQEWARRLGAGSVPTQRSTGEAPVRIVTPRSGERLDQIVEITGQAASEGFIAYRLEFGLGDPPAGWTLIMRSETPQPGGGLGLWNTADLPAGEYTLRLVLEDRDRGELSTYVVVRVGNAGDNGGDDEDDDDDDDDDDGPGRGPPNLPRN